MDKDLAGVDPATLERLKALVRGGVAHCGAADIAPFSGTICDLSDSESVTKWRERGLDEVAKGHVAVLLLAGGQGSRLGYDHPKGMYDLGLPSGKSLFQLQAERIVRVQQLACARAGTVCASPARLVHWFVLTSAATHAETVAFFEAHQCFGIAPECVHFVQQGMLPALDSNGTPLRESAHSAVLSPNGNGGVWQAMAHSGSLALMQRAGVQYVFQYGVDNVLVTVADPVLVGFLAASGSDVVSKVVRKTDPNEAVGVFCMRDGHPGVAEYTEISEDARTLRDPTTGQLVFSASHVCINAFTVAFLAQHALEPLPFHVAHKKVSYVDESGVLVHPTEPNAYKAEMFIFDMFRYAEHMALLCAPRESEFSPLKNASGTKADNPDTCRAALFALHRRWLEGAGATVDSKNSSVCEVSPLVSYGGEGLGAVKGRTFVLPLHLDTL